MTLRIAVAGAGLIGRRHIELIQASPSCELAAVVDPLPSSEQFAAKSHAPWYASLAELLEVNKPDAIVLATPNQLHVEQAMQCLHAGIPVLIEKPVAHTLAEGERLWQGVQQSGVPALVGHHRLHSAAMATARAVVASGQLGKIVGVVGTGMFYKAENEGYFDQAPWRKQPGGGPILINMIHEIGNLRALCGEIEEVQAFSSNKTRGFEVEDTAAIIFRFSSGALGTFLLSDTAASSLSWEHTSGEDPRYHQATDPNSDCYVIAGTFGSLSVPTMRMKRYLSAADQSWHKPLHASTLPFQAIDPMQAQLEHFCRVVRGQESPIVSVLDGLNNLRVVDAITRAGKTGSRVSVLA
jgi:predicted dehydrogenase